MKNETQRRPRSVFETTYQMLITKQHEFDGDKRLAELIYEFQDVPGFYDDELRFYKLAFIMGHIEINELAPD